MAKKSGRPTLAEACARFPHRYTMEHTPAWAKDPRGSLGEGKRCAPQFRTDAEWYANTVFPGEGSEMTDRHHCYTSGQTWPLGKFLPA